MNFKYVKVSLGHHFLCTVFKLQIQNIKLQIQLKECMIMIYHSNQLNSLIDITFL